MKDLVVAEYTGHRIWSLAPENDGADGVDGSAGEQQDDTGGADDGRRFGHRPHREPTHGHIAAGHHQTGHAHADELREREHACRRPHGDEHKLAGGLGEAQQTKGRVAAGDEDEDHGVVEARDDLAGFL